MGVIISYGEARVVNGNVRRLRDRMAHFYARVFAGKAQVLGPGMIEYADRAPSKFHLVQGVLRLRPNPYA